MKRDWDLCRKILLKIEDDYIDTAIMNLTIEKYSKEEVAYHCNIMYEAGLISSFDSKYADNRIYLFYVGGLTWEGHEFIEKIRDESFFEKIKKEITISKEVFAVGVSAMLMQVLTIIQQSILYSQAFRYGGDEAGSIMAATLRIMAFSFIPLWGMSQGLQPAIGTNFGAKEYIRVKHIFKIFLLSSILLAAIFWIPAMLFTENLLSLFGLSNTALINGILYFRIFYSVFLGYGIMIMTLTFFQAIGDAKSAGNLVIMRQIVIFVPAMIILPMFLGLNAIWLTFSDPFLRKRSAGRRLTHPHFLKTYAELLHADGSLIIKHDNLDFFNWSLEQLVTEDWRLKELTFDLHESSLSDDYKILTAYEQRWLGEGRVTQLMSAQRINRPD